jgi:hypothetical protein
VKVCRRSSSSSTHPLHPHQLHSPPASHPPQVTKFQLEQQRELDEKLKAEELKEKEMAAKRALSAEHYDKMVNVANSNKEVRGAGQGAGRSL